MKIKISYQEHEAKQAKEIEDSVKRRYNTVKVTKSDRYAPFFHTYLSVKNSDKLHK